MKQFTSLPTTYEFKNTVVKESSRRAKRKAAVLERKEKKLTARAVSRQTNHCREEASTRALPSP